jgi:hypothetical protein
LDITRDGPEPVLYFDPQVPMGDAVFMPPRKTGIPSSTQKPVLADFSTKNPDGWELIKPHKKKEKKIYIYILAFLVHRM